MLSLIYIEWLKFKKHSVIRLMMIFYLIMMPLAFFIGKQMQKLPDILPINTDNIFSFPEVWNWMGYLGSWLGFFFLGVAVVYCVTSEVQYRTQRQNIINGLSRKEYFLAKLGFLFSLVLFASAYYILWTLIIGFVMSDAPSISAALDNEWAILRFALMNLSFLSFAFFISFLLGRSGISVFLYLTYVLIIEFFIRNVFHKQIMDNVSVNFWPMNAAEDLMPLPIYHFAEMIPQKGGSFPFLLSYTQAGVASAFYVVLFISLAFVVFKRKDI